MLWVFMRHRMEYEEKLGKYLKPSLCHPFYAKERMRYIREKYDGESYDLTRAPTLHLDFGGMISTKEPTLEIDLGGGRIFSCWRHQVSWAIEELGGSMEVKLGRYTFRRFSSWPGTIYFISKTDLRKILKGLRAEQDVHDEVARRTELRERLVRANVAAAADGEKAEPEIRKLLHVPPAHGN